MLHVAKIDSLLQHAVETGDVPGVTAMATDRNGIIYEGAYGSASYSNEKQMTVLGIMGRALVLSQGA
jgi:hypothetical protein